MQYQGADGENHGTRVTSSSTTKDVSSITTTDRIVWSWMIAANFPLVAVTQY